MDLKVLELLKHKKNLVGAYKDIIYLLHGDVVAGKLDKVKDLIVNNNVNTKTCSEPKINSKGPPATWQQRTAKERYYTNCGSGLNR